MQKYHPQKMSSSASTSANTTKEYFYGWDLLYKTIERTVNKNSDVLIALVHFILTKHFNFQCIGVGEDKTISEDETGSELLPDSWNDDDNKYAMRYSFNGQLYLLLGHKSEDTLTINLLDVKTKNVSNIGLKPCDLVKKTKGTLYELIPTASQLVDRYRKELVDPVFSGTSKVVSTQTTTPQERSDPLRISAPMRPSGQFIPSGFEPRPFGYPDVGRGDLDPLGRGGPGNLFPFPSHPNFQGQGGRVPQPRFDPFSPNPSQILPNPDPDHLPAPGNPDYYM